MSLSLGWTVNAAAQHTTFSPLFHACLQMLAASVQPTVQHCQTGAEQAKSSAQPATSQQALPTLWPASRASAQLVVMCAAVSVATSRLLAEARC